ncbi:hypothetical protein S245_070542 [Arachis hypogaea]
MDGISKNSRKIRSEAAEYKYPLSLFSYDKWIKIATKVASNLIQELFQMKATCKVFLDAAKSDVVFKHSTMWYLLQGVSYFLDRYATRFVERCLKTGNPKDLFQDELMQYF